LQKSRTQIAVALYKFNLIWSKTIKLNWYQTNRILITVWNSTLCFQSKMSG